MSDTISFYRDAKTGKFITEAEAEGRPEGTVRETHTQKSVARMSDTLQKLHQENMALRAAVTGVGKTLQDSADTLKDVLHKLYGVNGGRQSE